MASQQSHEYIELEFLNVIYPVQHKEAAYRKKVRKHVMNQYWQARKIRTCSFSLPGDRQLRPFRTPPGCVCHGLGYTEGGETRKSCQQCGGGFSLRSKEKTTTVSYT